MGKLAEYNPSDVRIIWGPTQLNVGIPQGTFVTLSRTERTWTHLKGGDGEAARSRTNNFAGRVDFILRKGSATNTALSLQLQADELTGVIVLPFSLLDFNALTVWASPSAYLEGWPDDVYSTDETNRNWSLICDPMIPFPGGSLQP